MSKRTRQQAIIEIVTQQRIPSQAVLAGELKKRMFDVTQATLSRDIAELNLVKSKGGYTKPQDAGSVAGYFSDPFGILKRTVTKVTVAGSMIIVKTATGNAQPVAVALDTGMYTEILGTLAGDDTVFVATGTCEAAENLQLKLLESLN